MKSYNILGSYKEFKHQAAKERQIQLLSAKSSLIPINDSINNTGSELSTNGSEGKHVITFLRCMEEHKIPSTISTEIAMFL